MRFDCWIIPGEIILRESWRLTCWFHESIKCGQRSQEEFSTEIFYSQDWIHRSLYRPPSKSRITRSLLEILWSGTVRPDPAPRGGFVVLWIIIVVLECSQLCSSGTNRNSAPLWPKDSDHCRTTFHDQWGYRSSFINLLPPNKTNNNIWSIKSN